MQLVKPNCQSVLSCFLLLGDIIQYQKCDHLNHAFAKCIHGFRRRCTKNTVDWVCQWHMTICIVQCILEPSLAKHIVRTLGNLRHRTCIHVATRIRQVVWVIIIDIASPTLTLNLWCVSAIASPTLTLNLWCVSVIHLRAPIPRTTLYLKSPSSKRRLIFYIFPFHFCCKSCWGTHVFLFSWIFEKRFLKYRERVPEIISPTLLSTEKYLL